MTAAATIDVTTLPITARGYCVVIDGVALELTFDPADGTYGIKYAWTPPDDYADGFHPTTINEAVAEWVAWAEHDYPGHPRPSGSCYGCLGTGTLQWAGQRPGVACSCVKGAEG